jgi:hypothetical protein
MLRVIGSSGLPASAQPPAASKCGIPLFFWSVMILPLLLLLLLLPVLLISCARRARAPGRDRPLLLVSA